MQIQVHLSSSLGLCQNSTKGRVELNRINNGTVIYTGIDIGFMFIVGVNMIFRLNKSLMSLCPFTKILASPITPFFDGLDQFRRVVSSFRKASP